MKIIDRYNLWKDIMINTFDKVPEYLKKFYNLIEKDDKNKDIYIKYGNILFRDSDYLNNIKRLCIYVRTICDALQKCADLSKQILLPTIPSETPTPSPIDTPISIPTPIKIQLQEEV